jgi:hypothetical protein
MFCVLRSVCASMALAVVLTMGSAEGAPRLVEIGRVNGTVYAADPGGVLVYGVTAASGDRRLVYFDASRNHRVTTGALLPGKIVNAWTTSVSGEVFALVRMNGETFNLHRSADYGLSFTQVLSLGESKGKQTPGVRILHRGFTEIVVGTSRRLIVGEYNVAKTRISGGANDQVRILQSKDRGRTWSTIYTFNTDGIHSIRHIHAVRQDPISQLIYFALGDSGTEKGIIAWDGRSAWPAESLAPRDFRGEPGFYASTDQLRFWVTDLLFPGDGFVYAGMEGTILSPSSSKQKEMGIWRHSFDLQSSARVYPSVNQGAHVGSGIRLGVILEGPSGGPVQLWADVGNPATFSGPTGLANYNVFYMSSERQFASGAWRIAGQHPLNVSGESIPNGFVVLGIRTAYFSSPLGGTRVYEIH